MIVLPLIMGALVYTSLIAISAFLFALEQFIAGVGRGAVRRRRRRRSAAASPPAPILVPPPAPVPGWLLRTAPPPDPRTRVEHHRPA